MARFLEDEGGNRWYQDDEGNLMPSPRPGGIGEELLAQAGRQFADLGSGVKAGFGRLTGNEQLESEAMAETAARNRTFAGLDYESPITSAIGQAAPALATAPLTAGSLAGSLLLNAGLGAGESALDVGQGGSAGQRAIAGGIGGIVGDLGGRLAGRILMGAEGIAEALSGGRLAGSPEATAFEAVGGRTMAHQRMTDSLGQRFAERFSQGAEVGMFPSGRQGAVRRANDRLFKNRVAEAVGLDGNNYRNLGPDFRNDALQRLEDGFQDIASQARSTGSMPLTEQTANALKNSNQVSKLRKLGDFKGLDGQTPTLTGDEWVTARQALAEDAANAFKNGDGILGQRYADMVEEVDNVIKNKLPPEFLPEFARLREQYRVFNILEKPNVIGSNNQINERSLNRALASKSQGFGRRFTRGQTATNPETDRLLELARAADQPAFKPFKSSGTAENLQTDIFMDQATDATQGLVGGDPVPAAGFLMRNMIGPTLHGAAEMGGGLPYDYLFNRGNLGTAVGLGGGAGRGLLDEMFYPFVGVEDDRPRQ